MADERKTRILTVVYSEEGAEPCLVVAESTPSGKKEIHNIIHGINASGIFQILTSFRRVIYARGNGKSIRNLDMLNALEKLKGL